MVELVMATFAPYFRTNLEAVSFFGKPRSKTRECGDLEMDALECLQAYGLKRGERLCKTYVGDFRECMKQYIQVERMELMRRERVKQILRGERKFTEAMDPIEPPRDSYMAGPFYN